MKLITPSVQHLNHFTSVILDSAIRVHKEMGPGLLESVYHHCLLSELNTRGVNVQPMVIVPLHYRGRSLNNAYVIDVLVEGEIIVELKSVEGLLPIHDAQIISYLKLANKRLGLLINFNVPILKQGFKRFIN